MNSDGPKLRFGLCCGPDRAPLASDIGFDYFEMTVAALLKPLETEEAFRQALGEVRKTPIPCEAVNCFVPGKLKIVGPDADAGALAGFARTAISRAKEAGVSVIVFGSGGARRIPDGFDRRKAEEQIAGFCRMLGPVAAEHNVTVVVEPLNLAECNIINSVKEGAELVRAVSHPNLRLLADGYHMLKDGDPMQSIVGAGELLAHTHVATKANRLPPGAEECDLGPFFEALLEAKYSSRVSIEAKVSESGAELSRALELMRQLSSSAVAV